MSTDDTVRAYDLDAEAYAANGAVMPDSVRADLEAFVELLGPGARVLEIGSGGGRDARLMEDLGLRVRRTDITPGFVSLLRQQLVEAAGWGEVVVRSGVEGTRGETWLELSAVRDEVSP